ncbi:MAG TPA: hypothetical protein VGY56_12410, partial [Verrucomicrobiae bacterium]|nr:hypothetical protein [Verrucomicrobiae bacterium]
MLTITKNAALTFVALIVLTFAGFNQVYAQVIVTNFPTPTGGTLCAVNPNLDLLYFALGNPGGNPVVVMNGAT